MSIEAKKRTKKFEIWYLLVFYGNRNHLSLKKLHFFQLYCLSKSKFCWKTKNTFHQIFMPIDTKAQTKYFSLIFIKKLCQIILKLNEKLAKFFHQDNMSFNAKNRKKTKCRHSLENYEKMKKKIKFCSLTFVKKYFNWN